MIFALFIFLLAATGLMRLGEVFVSLKRMRERPEDVVSEPWLFPWMVLLHIGLVFAPLVEVILLHRAVHPALFTLSITCLFGATLLRIWTLRTIGYAWNVRVVTPPADGIATTGPYAWIRHPNYLVVILEIFALPLLYSAWISSLTLSILNAIVLFQRIRTEEAVLNKNPAWHEAFADRARLLPGII